MNFTSTNMNTIPGFEKMVPNFILVDDDPINNMLCHFGIRKIIGEAEIKMFTVPEDALEMILTNYAAPAENPYTFLFLDINMPSMTGWEFLEVFDTYDEYIKKKFKIFIVSSSVDDRDKDRAGVTVLVSGYLSKPVKAENIAEILSTYQFLV